MTVNNKPAYLWFVSPTQINMQTPDDTTGPANILVTTAMGSYSGVAMLVAFSPSFLLLDNTHVAGIISRTDGSGAYGGGSYDILGPTGTSLGFKTVAAKAGDRVAIYGVGFGPTNPTVPAGIAFSGAAPATNPVEIRIKNTSVTPGFAGLAWGRTLSDEHYNPTGSWNRRCTASSDRRRRSDPGLRSARSAVIGLRHLHTPPFSFRPCAKSSGSLDGKRRSQLLALVSNLQLELPVLRSS